jgi:hypothetical protein
MLGSRALKAGLLTLPLMGGVADAAIGKGGRAANVSSEADCKEAAGWLRGVTVLGFGAKRHASKACEDADRGEIEVSLPLGFSVTVKEPNQDDVEEALKKRRDRGAK